jgi:hypothetical protein
MSQKASSAKVVGINKRFHGQHLLCVSEQAKNWKNVGQQRSVYHLSRPQIQRGGEDGGLFKWKTGRKSLRGKNATVFSPIVGLRDTSELFPRTKSCRLLCVDSEKCKLRKTGRFFTKPWRTSCELWFYDFRDLEIFKSVSFNHVIKPETSCNCEFCLFSLCHTQRL